MIGHDIFKDIDPREHCSRFAYTVSSLARIGLLAAENDTTGIVSDAQRKSDLGTLFEVIDAMMAIVVDGADFFERDLKRGIWAKTETTP